MRHQLFGFLLPIFSCFASAGPSFATDSTCDFLLKNKSIRLEDGQLFAFGKSGWQTFDSLSELGAQSGQQVDFAFVIKTSESTDRTGVLVVKTNRPAADTDTEKVRNRVRLQRNNVLSDDGCPVLGSPNFAASVSTQSYRDYHDFTPRATAALRQPAEEVEPADSTIDGQFAALRAFHFSYRSTRKGRCIRTDNNEPDDFPRDFNSNRAQFSFDRTVVAGGSYGLARLFFWVPDSPFEGAAEHRVVVTKYSIQHGLACIRFRVPLRSANYTFRINDLESRTPESPRSRKGEQTLTRAK